MMTSKERAALRVQANPLEPVFQIGKGGVSDALVAQTDDALRARELIKLKALLETIPEPPKALARQLAARTGSDVVQVVGGSIVLYRYNPDLHKPAAKVRPKKAVKPGASRKAGGYAARGTGGKRSEKFPGKSREGKRG